MFSNIGLKPLLSLSILLYLFFTFFFYPYGFAVSGASYLRAPDLFALMSIIFGAAIVIIQKRIYRYPALEFVLLPFAFFEIIYPLLAVIALGAGVDQLANSLRMMLLWLPPLFLVWTTSPADYCNIDTKINNLLRFALIANISYGFIQMLHYLGLIPAAFVFTYILEPFAVDSHFRIINNIRASGFFVNTTGLAAFAMLCQSYFLGRFVIRQERVDLYFGALAVMTAIMTLSRAAMVGTIAITIFLWLTLGVRQKLTVPAGVFLVALIFLGIMDQYVGLSKLFYRYEVFMELGLGGALSDSSFSLRFYEFWPRILAQLGNYPFGTLSSPGDRLGLIDSGYLTYYAQGRWPFLVAAVVMVTSMLVLGIVAFIRRRDEGAIQIGFLSLYIAGAMVISIPTRYSFIVFFMVYAFWNHQRFALETRRTLPHDSSRKETG